MIVVNARGQSEPRPWRASSAALPTGMTLTRASAALGFTGSTWAASTYTSHTNNVPRFERLESESLGLLVEGARTASLIRSSAPSDATWSKTEVTIGANALAGPFGGTTADAVTETATTANHLIAYGSAPLTPTGSILLQLIVKPGLRTRFQIYVAPSGFPPDDISLFFDLSGAGSVDTIVNTPDGAGAAGTIVALPDGYYKCSFTGTPGNAGTVIYMHLCLAVGGAVSYLGSTASPAIWIQNFEGSSAAAVGDSPLETTTAAVTRNADVLVKTITAPASGFAFAMGGKTALRKSGNQHFLSLDDNTANNIVAIRRNSAGAIILDVTTGGSLVASITGGVVADNAEFTVAASIKANDMGLVVNGTAATRDTTAAMPTVTRLRYGHDRSNANHAQGHLLFAPDGGRWPGARTDAGLIALASRWAGEAVAAAQPWVASSAALPAGMTLTRASAALGLTGASFAASTYTSHANNTARFERLPSESVGLLIEGARTCLTIQSAAIDNAAWTKTDLTVTANAVAGLFAGTTADSITETATASAIHYMNVIPAVNPQASIAFQVLAKPGLRTRFQMYATPISGAPDDISVWFDMSGAGSSDTMVSTPDGSGAAGTVTLLPNGWFRCTMTGIPGNAGSSTYLQLVVAQTGNTVTYTGSTASPAMWIQNMEASNAAVPDSPIETTTVAVTRAADVTSKTISLSGSFAFALAARTASRKAGDQYVISIDDNTANNIVALRRNSAGALVLDVTSGGSLVASITGPTLLDSTEFSCAVSIALNSVGLVVNGVASTRDTTAALPTGLVRMRYGHDRLDANPWYGNIILGPDGDNWPAAGDDAAMIALEAEWAPGIANLLLTASGNQLLWNGSPVRLRGVATGDPYLGREFRPDSDYGNISTNWNSNAVRFGIHPSAWRDQEANSKFYLSRDINAALAQNMWVVVAWLMIGYPNVPPPNLAYDTNMALAADFWTWMAQTWGHDGRVAFELMNEPNSGNVNNDVYWLWAANPTESLRTHHTTLVNIVRTYSQNFIICSGDNGAFDCRGIKDALVPGGNIGYAWHLYAGHAVDVVSEWTRFLDNLHTVAPVICTEWGYDWDPACTGWHWCTTQPKAQAVFDYIEARQLHMMAWVFIPSWGPALVQGDWTTPTAYYGQFVKDTLVAIGTQPRPS